MSESAQQALDYRHEVLSRFFQYIQTIDSFYVIGAASMGKTRLLDHLMKPNVQRHYLGEQAKQHWLIRVDLNRMPVNDPAWAFYELLISSIMLELNNHERIANLDTEITKIETDIIRTRDSLLAPRLFELVINKLCRNHNLKLCFLFDEFDEAYHNLPREIFLQLRAVRDANKRAVSFGLFLRNLPELLRSPKDNESFYELLSRNPIGIGPYTRVDALEMIQMLETRKNISILPEQRGRIFEASGGHPGLILALVTILVGKPASFQNIDLPAWARMLIEEPEISEECRKIWAGLSEEEQEFLRAFTAVDYKKTSQPIEKLLFLKGLLQPNGSGARLFSDLFEEYIKAL